MFMLLTNTPLPSSEYILKVVFSLYEYLLDSVTCLSVCVYYVNFVVIIFRSLSDFEVYLLLMFIVSKSGGLIFNYDHNLPATKTEKTIQLTVGYIKVENQPCRALHVLNI